MYMLLAIVWLVAGIALIIYDNYTGDSAWVIRGLGWSPGWLMLLMSAYNFMRWWGRRMARAGREMQFKRRSYLRNPPPVRREPPDPNFNFSDEPPPTATAETPPPRE